MNIDLKSVFFGALLGGVFVAAVLTYLAPKSEVGRFEVMVGEQPGSFNVLVDTETGRTYWQRGMDDGWSQSKIN